MAAIEAVGKRRCSDRSNSQSSATPVRQDFGVLYFTHGQGDHRRTRSRSGFLLGHKRQNTPGKY